MIQHSPNGLDSQNRYIQDYPVRTVRDNVPPRSQATARELISTLPAS